MIVERFAPGHDYRLLVVGGRVVAAARREPAQVCGDGTRTVSQLVELVNADPRRADDHATALSKIKLDAVALAVLAEQKFTPESVPPAGAVVLIRRNGNLSTGGTAIDVTERVHPQVAAGRRGGRRGRPGRRRRGRGGHRHQPAPGRTTRRDHRGQRRPGAADAPAALGGHLPAGGRSHRGQLFPNGENGRIPIAAVTGVNGKTTTTRFIAHILKGPGLRVGMTCTDGIYLDGRRIECGDCSGPQSARSVRMNPHVDAAVLETARGGILREGLGFDRCDVAVVTNIGNGDHLGLCDINTPEALASVKRSIVDVVPPNGTAVLNAADPLVVAMDRTARGHLTTSPWTATIP